MSESAEVVAARLAAACDEADTTLAWVESARGPAVVRMARLRPVLAASGFGCLAAMAIAAEGDPAEAADVNRICRETLAVDAGNPSGVDPGPPLLGIMHTHKVGGTSSGPRTMQALGVQGAG